jgi:acetoacetate decarboxylase
MRSSDILPRADKRDRQVYAPKHDREGARLNEADVKARAFAMPLTSPAFPPGPYRFVDREYLIVTYRTDPDALRAIIPAPLEMVSPIVKYEFIRMPDSTGFGVLTDLTLGLGTVAYDYLG